MSNIIKLRQERADKVRELRKLVDVAEAANGGKGRALTNPERRSYESINDRIAAITGELDAIDEARARNDERDATAAELGLKRVTAAGIRGTHGRDETDSMYGTVRDAGTEPRSWAADVMAAARGDAEARDALTAYTRRVDDVERRTGLLVGTSTAGSEFAAPVLTDMGEGANIPRVYDRYYSAQAEVLPLGIGAEFVVPQVTTGSTVAATAEGGNVGFTDWVTATLTLDVKTMSGGVTLSQQFADLAPAFANAAIAADLAGKYAQQLESYAVTSTDTNAKGLEALASTNTVVTTGSDFSVVWRAILQAQLQLAGSGAYCQAEAIVTNPTMFGELLAGQGTAAAGTAIDHRPESFKFPDGSAGNFRGSWNGKTLGEVGSINGVPVIVTPAVAANSGGGTNESRIYVVNRGLGHRLFVSPMRTRIATGVGIATLQPKVAVFGYAAMYSPHPKAVSIISGTAVQAVALAA